MMIEEASPAETNQLLADKYRRSWIDGSEWERGEGVLSAINPADGQPLGETETVGKEGVDTAVTSARGAFTTWGSLPLHERKQMLFSFADGLAENAEKLARLESLEVGRPFAEAVMIIGMAPEIVRRYAAMIEHAQGNVINAESRQLGISWRRPRGVIGAIVPWNFPVLNVIVRLAPALAAGNTIVVKSSENAPRTVMALARIATDAGLPDGVFNAIIGTGPVAGQALAAHRDIDLLTFTGSTQTGLAISRAAATSTLKPVLMECGGKSPQIVLDDAFDDPAIWHPIFFSAFWNSGQWCAAKTRLLVPRNRILEAVSGLQAAATAWTVGHPMASSTRLGPLANAAQHNRVMSYYEEARQAGTVVELGCPQDHAHPAGYYAAPSVAIDQPRQGRIMREEVFGPLLSIEGYDDVDDAIALANDSDYGLMASVWTNRSDMGYRLAREIVAGGISINSSAEAAAASTPDLVAAYLEPQKQSGHGMDGGVPGLLAYTTAQSVTWLN